MLRFLGKTTGSAARNSRSCPMESVGEGLSTWEFVNEPQSDDEDLYSYDSDDVTSDGDGSEFEPNPVEEGEENGDDDDINSVRTLLVLPPITFPVEMTSNYEHNDYAEGYTDDNVYNDDDDDELHDVDDDDDVYDHEVDDELMPWKLKDRFGKQRIKKMGKRSGPKLGKAKGLPMPYYDNRPGFLYGKFRGRY